MADQSNTKQGIVQIKRMANAERPVFYVNNAQVFASQWDVQLYFSMVHEVTPGDFAAVESALVIMTPEHALALTKALQLTLDAYAKQQGNIRDIVPIQVPPQG